MPLRSLVKEEGKDFYPNHNTPVNIGGFNYDGSVTPIFDGVPNIDPPISFRQRSYKFGQGTAYDRPDEGFSSEPLIGKNIDLPGIDDKPSKALGLIDSLTDSLIRGGITTAATRTAKDVARITKFYITNRGIGFLLKNIGLQRTNPVIRKLSVDTESAEGFIDSIGEGISNLGGSNSNQRVYNLGINTLASVAGSAFGLHIKREGVLPTSYEGYIDDIDETSKNSYPGDFTPNLIDQDKDPLAGGNRLINLFGSHILANTLDTETESIYFDELQNAVEGGAERLTGDLVQQAAGDQFEGIESIMDARSGFSKFLGGGNDLGKIELFQYSGGPGSLYGIGKTVISKASTPFNTLGQAEIGGKIIQLNDATPWLNSKTGYFNRAIIETAGAQGEPTMEVTTTTTEDLSIDGSEKLDFGYGDPVTTTEVVPNPNYVPPAEYTSPGALYIHPIYKDNITNYFELKQKEGLKGGHSIMMEPGKFLKPAGKLEPENRQKLSPIDPIDQTKNYVYKKDSFPASSINALVGKEPSGKIPSLLRHDDKRLGASQLDTDRYKQATSTSNTARFIREQRINLGNPGKNIAEEYNIKNPGKNKFGDETISYDVYDPDTVDKINALDIFRNDTNASSFGQSARDLIRFRIEAIDGDEPTKSKVMVFRAHLKGWEDSYTGQWNSFKYNGRAEDFYTYGGFERAINFDFTIAAQSRHEMMPLYRKLNYLVSQTAPEYKQTRMRGSFVRITIGSLMDRTPGFFNSINLSLNSESPWEIAVNEPEGGEDDDGMLLMPHIMEVRCQFTPIHTFIPQKSVTRSPFILPTHSGLKPKQKWYSFSEASDHTTAGVQGQVNKLT